MTLEDYIVKYGEDEGPRRWKGNEYGKRRYQEHREELLEKAKQYKREHRELYNIHSKRYHQKHREERLEYMKRYQETPYGRAQHLLRTYRRNDRQYNRGECTITVQWIVDSIFTRRCLYCGESDWHKLGCDRIDNNKPHTPNNVVCCCKECNKKRGLKDFLLYAYSIGAKDSDGLVISY